MLKEGRTIEMAQKSRNNFAKAYNELLRRCNGKEFFIASGALYVANAKLGRSLSRIVTYDSRPWTTCIGERRFKDCQAKNEWEMCVVDVLLEIAKMNNVVVLENGHNLVVIKKGECLESLLVSADLMDVGE